MARTAADKIVMGIAQHFSINMGTDWALILIARYHNRRDPSPDVVRKIIHKRAEVDVDLQASSLKTVKAPVVWRSGRNRW